MQANDTMGIPCQTFADRVKEKSNGRIQLTLYFGRQLGDDRQLTEAVQQGSLDMFEISAVIVGNTNPGLYSLQLPFLFRDWDKYKEIVCGEAGQKLLDDLEETNLKGLAFFDAGFRVIATNKRIEKLEDMEHLKIRTAETPLHVDIFKALGTNPTPMVFGEVYSGLQNRVIDACETTWSGFQSEKYGEVADYAIATNHFTWPGLLAINKDIFDSLSVDDQNLLVETAKEVQAEHIEWLKNEESNYKKLAEEVHGVTIIELPDSEWNRLVEATKGVWEDYSGKYPAIAEFVNYVEGK
ncbi:MAG TPA: TRAP transporter substrate-binding protein [Clostridiaceae bacterium]|nr:TRAP transporter substrate-binding protein [Clostridiaceae bacterium]